MLIVTVVIASSIIISSAQPSTQCIAAYNATFDSSDKTCLAAYVRLLQGAYISQDRMMVCDAGQQCNTMIENVIDICGDTIDSPTRFLQDILCTTGPNGLDCYNTISHYMNSDSIFDMIFPNCLNCSQDCMQNLIQLNNTVGCCFTEVLKAGVNEGSLKYDEASLLVNALPELCDLEALPLCNGSILPPTQCDNATVDFFAANDECSRTVQDLFSNRDAVVNLYDGDCPMRFNDYATVCRDAFGDQLVHVANGVLVTSKATTSYGRSCSDFAEVLAMDHDFQEPCSIDFLLRRQCTSSCTQLLTNLTAEYECCFNTYGAEFFGRNGGVSDQIEYAILTRDIYDLCGIESGGFCSGQIPDPPAYSDAAEQCINAKNSFFADDTCLDYYLTLGLRSSATAVNNAANAICTNHTCYSRMSSYISFLHTCQVGSIDDRDDDDDNDNDGEIEGYLELIYLTENTTCRVDSDETSCYSSIISNPQYDMVSAAFNNDGDSNAVCASVVTQGTCSPQCTQFLTQAYNSLGCCLGEYGRIELGADGIQSISTLCNVPLATRCSDISVDESGGANTQQGFGMLFVLLLGMIAITFSA